MNSAAAAERLEADIFPRSCQQSIASKSLSNGLNRRAYTEYAHARKVANFMVD